MNFTLEEIETNKETFRHILTVRSLLMQVIQDLCVRANKHDLSKLTTPEVDTFTRYTANLKYTEYGSDKYKQCLIGMKPALDNHYSNNSHHPEHYENGINGFDILDLVELLVDWKASSLRSKNGNLEKSLEIQKERFGIDNQLYDILKNSISLIENYAKEANVETSYKGNIKT